MHGKLMKVVVTAALAIGITGGSYGLAAAATSKGKTTAAASATAANAAARNAARPSGGQPWGGQRSDETVQTGDVAAKITAVVNAKLSGATIVRIETDADGNAAYEAHVTKADGTPATVYVDKDFNYVSTETR
jgi:hypothetical protein